MSRDSNTHTVSVVSPSGTALSVLAASMSAGTWAQLTTVSVSIIGSAGSQGGVGGNMIPYANQAVWDPVSNAIRFCGNDHHGATPGWTEMEVQYLESTNTWSAIPALGIGNQIPGISASHGYGHIACRPDTGELYMREYGGGSGFERIWRKAIGGSWLAPGSGGVNSPSVYRQVGIGTGWWSGTLTGSQSMGAYIMWCQGFGVIQIYDPGLNTWQQIDHPDPGGDGLYHGVLDYSPPLNVAVFGGGNAWTRKMWKLNSNRTVTQLTDAPIDVGVQLGNLSHDPVTGKFLIWGGGQNRRQFWELDPAGTGTYTQLTGSRQPPAQGLNGVSDPSGGPGGPDALISCALPEHNVVMYMSAGGPSYANCFLYKHSASASFDFATTANPLPAPWQHADATNQSFVRSLNGRAFGTTAAAASPPPYNDANAYLTGYGTNYEVDTVIFRNASASSSPNREVAILLRCFQGNSRTNQFGTSSAHYYYFSWSHIGAYLILNDFLSPAELTRASSAPTPVTGDRFRARIEGRRMRCWVNDVLQIDYTDNSADYSTSNPNAAGYHPTGDPGIGFFCDNGASTTDFGFESVTVTAL